MPKRSSNYDFTIITAVYNTAEYLDECIKSVLAQTVGIKRIQLILVDDASTDGSLERCRRWGRKYPNNIKVVAQGKNQGVSAARNAGLALAKGKYVNFLDSDDKFTPDICEKVEQFFEQHPGEVDVVALPIVFFDGETGEHPLNTKFQRGTRIIDLDKEWQYTQNFVNSIFVRSCALELLRFDTRMPISEDLKFVQQILLKKHRLGVISDTTYLYRRRSGTNQSAIQTKTQKKYWYIPTLQNGLMALFDEARQQDGTIPKYLQFLAMYELKWRLMMRDVECPDITRHERKEYYHLIHLLLKEIDNDEIENNQNISPTTKNLALKIKRDWNINTLLILRRLRLLNFISDFI